MINKELHPAGFSDHDGTKGSNERTTRRIRYFHPVLCGWFSHYKNLLSGIVTTRSTP